MKLVVFDIDGTLIRYHQKRNDRAYVRALKEVLGIEMADNQTVWSGFKSSTDSGILAEIIEKHLGQPTTSAEIEDFKEYMAGLLDQEYGKQPFEATDGAKEFWEFLGAKHGWCRALGTGNFEFSGRFKLQSAGFNHKPVPMGSADDGAQRELVLAAARDRALKTYQVDRFEKIIYVGDYSWDVEAADALGWDFVGIGKDKTRDLLKKAGARVIFEDFHRMNGLLK